MTCFLFCFVFATLHGLRDLNSLTRNWTLGHGSESWVLTTGPPGNSLDFDGEILIAYSHLFLKSNCLDFLNLLKIIWETCTIFLLFFFSWRRGLNKWFLNTYIYIYIYTYLRLCRIHVYISIYNLKKCTNILLVANRNN